MDSGLCRSRIRAKTGMTVEEVIYYANRICYQLWNALTGSQILISCDYPQILDCHYVLDKCIFYAEMPRRGCVMKSRWDFECQIPILSGRKDAGNDKNSYLGMSRSHLWVRLVLEKGI